MKTALPAPVFFAFVFAVLVAQPGRGQLDYDTNGATPGTSTSSTQNFTGLVWTTDPTGSSATTGYTPGSDVVFSATDGVNVGTGAQNVTVTDTESADGFTFNNGTVTLLGSGSPNLSIGAGGITAKSTDGATTFDSSLGTVTASASQPWNNDSTQALNFNSGLTSSGSTITFAGTGSGVTNLSGVVSGSVNLTQDSASSVLYLNNNSNSFTGTVSVGGGTLVAATEGALGNGSNVIDLSNGGIVAFDNTMGFAPWTNNIVLGTGGGGIYAGNPGVSSLDIVYTGIVTGGGTLNVLGGDFLPSSIAASDIGTINVAAGRMLMFGGNGLLGNNATVNVSSGAIMDFGVGGTLGNTINLADGSFLEARVSTATLTGVVFPTNGTVNLGSDDTGSGALNIDSAIALNGSLTVDLVGVGNGTPTDLSGAISGSGTLTFDQTGNGNTHATLSGPNTYAGTTILNAVTIFAGNQSFGSSTVDLNNSTVDLTGGTLSNPFLVGTGGTVQLVAGAGAQTVAGPIELNQSNGNVAIANRSSANLTVGSITFDNVGPDPVQNDDRVALIDAYGTGSIYFDGTYTSPVLPNGQFPTDGQNGASTLFLGYLSQNGAANYYITPTTDFSKMEPFNVDGKAAIWMFDGNLYLQNSSFVLGQYVALEGWGPNPNTTITVEGAQTINLSIYTAGASAFSVTQATADSTKWNGEVDENGTDMTISVVSGGRLEFTNNVGGFSNDGITVTGGGVVVFSNSIGNNFGSNADAVNINQGTLLVNNLEGGGLGNNSGTVYLAGGATLGGSGNISQQVVATGVNGDSILTAGDPGQASLGLHPKIGSLTIAGLSAVNGLTFAFKFDNGGNIAGVDYDLLTIGSLDLGGTVTFDLSTLDGFLQTGVVYQLITGTQGLWTTESNLQFNFVLPAGYILDPNYLYGGTPGYDFDIGSAALAVQFALAPEPSTYALLAFGLLGLAAIRRCYSPGRNC